MYTVDRYYQGNIVVYGKDLLDKLSDDPVSTAKGVMAPFWGPAGAEAWCWVGAFGVFQAILQLLVPGSTFRGPVSPKGNVPVYKANGLQCYFVTVAAFFIGTSMGWFNPARLYDIFAEVLSVLNIFSLGLCAFLTLKGLVFPSSSDSGSNGSVIYDFWWGTELYPRIGPLDIKTWTNCRMGMMSWVIIPICFAYKQAELYGEVSNSMLVSVTLTSLYNLKFFMWETGYWKTMDIAHDRAGYYLCWGCLNWVPGVYTSQSLYLTNHPNNMSTTAALATILAGCLMIYINWEADVQRQTFRETGGKCRIWGKEPLFLIAKYKAGAGEEKSSLLLLSGWWGVARHFHYLPEILAAVCWTLPAQTTHFLPWFYVVFLTLLLLDRLYRDDTRCKAKYGQYWDKYCEKVPYSLIPYII